jgi:hypothetical protein
MGGPFYMDFDRLLDADVDELAYLVGLVSVRMEMEKKSNG